MLNIGVLNIQGGIEEHCEVIKRNNHQVTYVTDSEDLVGIDAIILPGGESTVMKKIIDENPKFKSDLKQFVNEKPVYATCAGLILLANNYLNALDFTVKRNGFGAQIKSISTELDWLGIKQEGLFIRAPYITNIDEEADLCFYEKQIVGIKTERIMAMAFHPELTNDDSIFNYFIEKCIKI